MALESPTVVLFADAGSDYAKVQTVSRQWDQQKVRKQKKEEEEEAEAHWTRCFL